MRYLRRVFRIIGIFFLSYVLGWCSFLFISLMFDFSIFSVSLLVRNMIVLVITGIYTLLFMLDRLQNVQQYTRTFQGTYQRSIKGMCSINHNNEVCINHESLVELCREFVGRNITLQIYVKE